MNVDAREVRGENPTSDRWAEYYREARARRRARGPELRTRVKVRRYRNRQRAKVVSGFLAVGFLATIFYVVLAH